MIDVRVLARATAAALALCACAQAPAQSSAPRAGGPTPAQLAQIQANPFQTSQADSPAPGPEQACAPPPTEPPRPPVYPPEMIGKPAPPALVLVLSLDRCGQVTQVHVERSTGVAAFDQSGIDAAKTWRMSPELKDGQPVPSRVRVPVRFQEVADETADAVPAPGAAGGGKGTRPSAEEMYAGWQRMRVPKTPRNADGTMPGYLPDPRPMQGGFEDNLRQLKRERRLESQDGGVERYVSDDIFDISTWDVFERGFVFSPAIVRMRLVNDGEKAFWVTSSVCGARAPDGDCAKLEEFLRASAKPQTPKPPPPDPPAGLGGKR